MSSTRPPRDGEGWHEHFIAAADGTRLYARKRAREGALTVVLCDGIACDGFIWKYLADDLPSWVDVVHWHYRGHGRSGAPVHPDHIDMPAFAGDLAAVRAALVHSPAVLVGHSMGCQIALEGYRSRSEGLAGLVLICGAPGRLTHTFKGSDALARALPGLIDRVERHPFLSRALWGNLPPEVATRIALATGEVDAAAIRPEDLNAYSEHVATLDVLMFLRMLRVLGDATAEDVLPDVAVPVLVVAGSLDSFTPTHLAEAMAARMPRSELMLVEGATHVVPIERRELVRDRLTAFLERLVPGFSPPTPTE